MKLDRKSFGCGVLVGGVLMFIVCAVLLLCVAWRMNKSRLNAESALAKTATGTWGDAPVCELLKPIRQKHGIPGMVVVLVTSKGVVVAGGVGGRKRDSDMAIGEDDLWHLGSDTKAMTATLVAKLVEQNKLKWDSTVAEVFPDEASKFHADMKGVTVLHLLSHRAGLPANADWQQFRSADVKLERLKVLQEELSRPPRHKPGNKYEYSNLSYVIAGAIVEKVTGKTWEQAIHDEIFEPLEMKSAGFGGTGTPGKIDQPWPHTSDGRPADKNGSDMDNYPVMGPAGRVHCSIQDWAKFIRDQLRGGRGEVALLNAETYQKLHTPPFGGDYALGWLTTERSWGGGKVLNHAGDNTMNHANAWVAPRRDFAMLVCVNQSGKVAFMASDEVVGELIKLHEEKAGAKQAK